MEEVGGELSRYVVCRVCLEAVPASEVEPSSDVCFKCIRLASTRQNVQKARERARDAFKEMIRAAKVDAIDAPHITQVCAGVIRELGGLDRFCVDLVEDYRDARERAPGSAVVMRFGEGIIKLVRDSSAMRDTAPDAISLSEDELAAEMIALVDQVARRNRLTHVEQDLIDAMADDGKQDEEQDGRAGGGAQEEAAGGPSVLPSDS